MTWKDKLKQKWQEDPWLCIMVAGVALGGAAKLIDAWSAAKGRQAYAKQVDYRINSRQ